MLIVPSQLVDHGRNERRNDEPSQPRVVRRVGENQAGLDKGVHVSQQVDDPSAESAAGGAMVEESRGSPNAQRTSS